MTARPSISEAAWLLLVVSLPTSAATPRMRLWRGIKSLGSASLRDGAYLLPNLPGQRAHACDRPDDRNYQGGHFHVGLPAPES